MRHAMIRAAAIAAAAISVLAAGAAVASGAPQPGAAPQARPASVQDVCPVAAPGHFRCFAELRMDVHGGTGVRGPAAVAARHPAGAALPQGYGPADLRSAYQLPASGGRGQTVAITDVGDDPVAEADLAVYRATYGLPPCTTANGCFRKVNQRGNTDPLPPDQGWGGEISLDLDMVSAACPSCHILLVEADSPTIGDLAAAEDTATRLGANEVSNSYGAPEQNGMQPYEAAYAHPGAAIVASSGDSGYGIPQFPAVFRSVIAVGGTTLTRAGAHGWAEAAWPGAASGCSAWIPKPAWQHDPDCPGRMVTDVAADADPKTGPAIYDAHDGYGWTVAGGTSASAPFIAGVIALAGDAPRLPNASYLYTHAHALHDIVTGNNAALTQCGRDYLCTAVPGYDGPTGNGTPHGLRAF
ncbi:MAG TPA: S53 family peptidase [Streptosporangiaceae bacterium]|nr:S53 family peptidase [Streptosporangiaceae bacterium]